MANTSGLHTGSPADGQPSTTEAFPRLNEPTTPRQSTTRRNTDSPNSARDPGTPNTSSMQGRLRSASRTFQESNPPTGMWIATGQIASSIPSVSDIRRGSFSGDGWSAQGQVAERERRASLIRRGSSTSKRRSSGNDNRAQSPQAGIELPPNAIPEAVAEAEPQVPKQQQPFVDGSVVQSNTTAGLNGIDKETTPEQRRSYDAHLDQNESRIETAEARIRPFDNGYQFPPKHSRTEATVIFCKGFWKFFTTPIGFLVVVYGLNIIAWGGMLFLLLCNASPAMCKPTCNNINSPRRIWIEIDSQILNALFCVTGFGTIPWRFRDLYYLLQYRIKKDEVALRRLAGINRSWFRLPGSEELPINIGLENIELEAGNLPEQSVAYPLSKMSNVPLTGIRAPPTPIWKLDFVIWAMVWNTFLQAVLSGFMWGFNRYQRPSWSTGLFVALASIVAACGGIMSFVEGKKVKSIEGVPVSEKDQERLKRDREQGILHYNNIKDEKPKEKKAGRKREPFKGTEKAVGGSTGGSTVVGLDKALG